MKSNEAGITPTLTLLDRLKNEMPEIWNRAQVVGSWVWLEFTVPPVKETRGRLKKLGFHWNAARKCWQHPCGKSTLRSRTDPRGYYPVSTPADVALNDLPRRPAAAKEFKIVALRECPLPEAMQLCDEP